MIFATAEPARNPAESARVRREPANAGLFRGPLTPRPLAGLAGITLLLLGLSGCARGVHWRFGTYEDGYNEARHAGKLTFVYFRVWYLVECTNFEDQVLKDPQVLAETDRMVCVPLDFDWDKPLAQRWNLTAIPAFAIVAPSGEILAQRQTPLTKLELLADIRSAREAPSTPQRAASQP